MQTVNLWYARNEVGEIILIENACRNEKYKCPICGSEVIPKAIEEYNLVSAHFAHIDKSKCSSESYIHFWFKNKLIQPGDVFSVKEDYIQQYTCKEILVENPVETRYGLYIPDLTVLTMCGETIYFEMNYKNKKNVDDYILMWNDLERTVVEVGVKTMLKNINDIPTYDAIYYFGKQYKTRASKTRNPYKEIAFSGKSFKSDETIEKIRKIDWFLKDIELYSKGLKSLDEIMEIVSFLNRDDTKLFQQVISRCDYSDINRKYWAYQENKRKELEARGYHKFIGGMSKTHWTIDEIDRWNKILNGIDENYCVKIIRHRTGREKKVGYYTEYVLEYHTVDIKVYYKNKNIGEFKLSNEIIEDKNISKLDMCIKSILDTHSIKLKCTDCSSKFLFSFGEMKFFREKKFQNPKRCKECRNKRR